MDAKEKCLSGVDWSFEMPLWVNLSRIYYRKTDNASLNLTNTEGNTLGRVK